MANCASEAGSHDASGVCLSGCRGKVRPSHWVWPQLSLTRWKRVTRTHVVVDGGHTTTKTKDGAAYAHSYVSQWAPGEGARKKRKAWHTKSPQKLGSLSQSIQMPPARRQNKSASLPRAQTQGAE
ncbi:hypothetical protein HPB50_009799 [Hyalomma asiaticum]|uniref:Uncharacterized protein n=1 Tax=Hyalomma asiaticum TaxID=266040 RepID=A0ACB7TK61_HYAAI|nr:hypothetical protein HPB50_009799 [Hyalomma asiaticum]